MLRTYSTNITTTANNAIAFNINKLSTNSNIVHEAGSTNISVNRPGYYSVTLDASYTAAAAGAITLQLFADDVAIPDAIINSQVTANENVNNSFTTIIRATPGMFGNKVSLSVKPTADITINNIALGIEKISNLI